MTTRPGDWTRVRARRRLLGVSSGVCRSSRGRRRRAVADDERQPPKQRKTRDDDVAVVVVALVAVVVVALGAGARRRRRTKNRERERSRAGESHHGARAADAFKETAKTVRANEDARAVDEDRTRQVFTRARVVRSRLETDRNTRRDEDGGANQIARAKAFPQVGEGVKEIDRTWR